MSIPTIFTASIESRLIQLHQYQLSANFLCQYTFKNNRKNLGHKAKANLHRSLLCYLYYLIEHNNHIVEITISILQMENITKKCPVCHKKPKILIRGETS